MPVTVTTNESTIPRYKLSFVSFNPYPIKHKIAPNQSSKLKKPVCVSSSLSHSGFSYGGFNSLNPSSICFLSTASCVRPRSTSVSYLARSSSRGILCSSIFNSALKSSSFSSAFRLPFFVALSLIFAFIS